MKFPWLILLWSLIGCIALRDVFTDNFEYLGACAVYGVLLGFVAHLIEIHYEGK
jgi:hypothetical protein